MIKCNHCGDEVEMEEISICIECDEYQCEDCWARGHKEK